MALLIEAGQMTASDYVPIYPDLLLASEGASTDVDRSPLVNQGGASIRHRATVTRSPSLIGTTRLGAGEARGAQLEKAMATFNVVGRGELTE
jgi:hypothetical protein